MASVMTSCGALVNIRLNEMASSMICPKCASTAVRPSRRHWSDGLSRLLFYAAFRCRACGHRYHCINLWVLAWTVAVLVLIALFSGIVYMLSTYYAQPTARPLESAQAVMGSA